MASLMGASFIVYGIGGQELLERVAPQLSEAYQDKKEEMALFSCKSP